MAKLTDDGVRWARARWADGWSERQIATHLNVDRSSVNRAVNGLTWAHLLA